MTERQRVKRNLPVEGGRRILLYFWGHETAPRIRNFVCVDAHDALVWQAELPPSTSPDCFVSIDRSGDVIEARTYRGQALTICTKTGATLS